MKLMTLVAMILSLNFSIAHANQTEDQANCMKKITAHRLDDQLERTEQAWCYNQSDATYPLEILLSAIKAKKASFHSGAVALSNSEGFTALALGGYQLDAGVVFKTDKGRFVVVQFVGPENHRYISQVTYQIDSSVSGL
jgi:hypothetical protein